MAGYLLGSIPFGLLFTRLAGAGDIRTIGSGNIGATNVLRTGRKGIAALTLLCDLLKGTAAVLLAKWLGPGPDPAFAGGLDLAALAAGLGAFLGHCFPVWLKFRGGKGVATFIGVLLGFSVPIAAGFGVTWLAVAALTRYSSVAGLSAATVSPLLLWATGADGPALLFALMAAVTWAKHAGNLKRLIAGTETKIGKGSAARSADPG
ncbi:Acyl-phosphate:glycerol-3-phosphate O-acyltransferase PlsY [Rhodovulum sp. PH10]|nr:Acyl-phosphate:glycerol-3-phosphate O-acyltransferase PlsY [Rhodovulum sp. PH10]